MDARTIDKQLAGERTSSGPSVISRAVARAWPQWSSPDASSPSAPRRPSRGERCPRCGRTVTGPLLLIHAKAEEYLLELIKRDHPEWGEPDGTCPRCAAYYRTLVEQVGV